MCMCTVKRLFMCLCVYVCLCVVCACLLCVCFVVMIVWVFILLFSLLFGGLMWPGLCLRRAVAYSLAWPCCTTLAYYRPGLPSLATGP
jgi:hypothetical protein